jgi:hypothetical protein
MFVPMALAVLVLLAFILSMVPSGIGHRVAKH